MQHISNSSNRRRARRLIYQAMAGAALGVGLLVCPALAANPVVNTANDVVDPNDGLTSLREAINAANADSTVSLIQFSPGLGIDPTFTLDSALPSITNANTIGIDTSAVGSITLPQPLDVNGGNVILSSLIGATQLNADLTINAQSTVTLLSGQGGNGGDGSNSDLITGGGFGSSDGAGADGVDGSNANVTGDVTVAKSTFNIFASAAGAGGNGGTGIPGGYSDTGGAGGFGGNSGSASVTGNVNANDSTVMIGGGKGAAGGNGGDGQTAAPGGFGGLGGFGADGGFGGNAGITGGVTAANSTLMMVAGDAGVGGNGGYGDASDSAGGIGGDAGVGGDGGFATITGKVDAANSSLFLIGGDGARGGNDGAGGAGGWAGSGGFGGIAGINGDVNAAGSTILLGGGDGGAGGDGGYGGVGGDANITGDITAAKSTFGLEAGNGGDGYNSGIAGDGGNASITGDVNATDSSFTLVGGNDGNGANFGFSGNSFIDGSFTGNGNSELSLQTADGLAYVTKDVTLNGTSKLLFSGMPILNFNSGATTFGPNATLLAPLDFASPTANLLTVNDLALNDSRLQPFWNTPQSTFTIGQTFNILQYNGNATGEFDHVYSPLTFNVNYGGGTADGITLSISGMDFTQASGNANQSALEGYLNNFVNTAGGVISLNQADLPFNLANLTQQISQNGPGTLDQYIPDNLAAQNAETFSNQQAFVNSILDNLRNANYQTGGSTFALNQSLNIGQTGAQLVSLRRAMNAPFHALNANGNNSLPSSGVWAAYNGSRSRVDADQGLGSGQWSQASDGYTVGYTSGGEGLRWGAAIGHQKSTLSFADLSATGRTDGYNAGLYAAWTRKSTYLNALLGYGHYDNDANRALGSLYFKSKALSGALELGHHLGKTGSGFTPYGQLQWTHLKNESATDTGSGLTLRGGSHNVYSTALGVRYNQQMKNNDDSLKGGWEAGLAWLHQFGDTDFSSNASYSTAVPGSFPVQTTPLDGNALQMRLGAYGRIHGNLIGFAGYQGTFGSSQKINAVNAGVGYQF